MRVLPKVAAPMLFVLCVVLLSATLYAQAGVGGTAASRTAAAPSAEWVDHSAEMDQFIAESEKAVKMWGSRCHWQLTLLFCVGLLGIVVSGCQGSDAPVAKRATFLLGLLISGLTLASKTFFDSDSKAYTRAGNRGSHIIRYMKGTRSDYKVVPPEAKNETWKQFRDEEDDFQKVEDSVIDTQTAVASHLEKVVYAAEDYSPPGWTKTNGTRDRSATYFVGTGVAETLDAAKAQAQANAVFNAAQSLLPTKTWSTDDDPTFSMLGPLVAQHMAVREQWFTYDPIGGRYISFVRIAMDDDVRQTSGTFETTVSFNTVSMITGDTGVMVINRVSQGIPELFIFTPNSSEFSNFGRDAASATRAVALARAKVSKCFAERLPRFNPQDGNLGGCVKLNSRRLASSQGGLFLGKVPYRFHPYQLQLKAMSSDGATFEWIPVL